MDHVRLGGLLLRDGGLREDLLEAIRSERRGLPRARLRRAAIAAGAILLVALLVALARRTPPAPAVPKAAEGVPVADGPHESVLAYDFRDASQGLEWRYLAHRAARARFPYDMHIESGATLLRNGEAVHVSTHRGEARIAATVWQDSPAESPCFGLFAGPLTWAVVTGGSSALRPRSGGPPIRSAPFATPQVGTRLRVEMSIAGGRVICTVDGRIVFDQPIEVEEPIEVGVFSFRDTLIGFDDVVVDPAPSRKTR